MRLFNSFSWMHHFCLSSCLNPAGPSLCFPLSSLLLYWVVFTLGLPTLLRSFSTYVPLTSQHLRSWLANFFIFSFYFILKQTLSCLEFSV